MFGLEGGVRVSFIAQLSHPDSRLPHPQPSIRVEKSNDLYPLETNRPSSCCKPMMSTGGKASIIQQTHLFNEPKVMIGTMQILSLAGIGMKIRNLPIDSLPEIILVSG